MSTPWGVWNYVPLEVQKRQLADLEELERQMQSEHHPEGIKDSKTPKRLPTRHPFWNETVEWQDLTQT